MPAALRASLEAAGVAVRPYDQAEAAVAAFAKADGAPKLMLDPERINFALRSAAGAAALEAPSPLALPKALKNSAELAGMRAAHLRDGAALANFFGWLRRTVVDEGTAITETEMSAQLQTFREAQSGFLDLSFPTIAGSGPNGAIIHYDCSKAETPGVIDGTKMLLIDSGGQYEDGTTDVTRTLHLGTPTAFERECFTRVLKGNIGLDSMTFPDGTPGMAIDAFARASLWQAGLDYLHGTGHGVGAALNVHEGPQSISTRYHNTQGLKAGMVVSNEPGYYDIDAGFGIRIENLLVIGPKATAHSFNGREYLGFDPLTMVPIQQSLIEPSLLTDVEANWLDSYHARVWDSVSPLMEEGSEGYLWLKEHTRPLDRKGAAAAAAAAPAVAAAAA